jgi:hypothetical protein
MRHLLSTLVLMISAISAQAQMKAHFVDVTL